LHQKLIEQFFAVSAATHRIGGRAFGDMLPCPSQYLPGSGLILAKRFGYPAYS